MDNGNTEVTQVTGHNGLNLCFRGGVDKLNIQGREITKGTLGKLIPTKTTAAAANKIYQQGGQGSVNIVIGGSAKDIVIQSGK